MDTVDQRSINAHCKMVASVSPSPVSANAQLRKIKKPLIEKRRRERINECLVQLKALVLEAMNKDGSQYSKMEKADILEMTVAHLKSIGSSLTRPRPADTTVDAPAHATGLASSPPVAVQRYVSGYTECAMEVANYLSTAVTVDPSSSVARQLGDNVRHGLLEHLDSCLHRQTSRLASSVVTRVGSPSMPVSPASCVDDRLAVGPEASWSRPTEENRFTVKMRTLSTEDDCSTSSSIGFERLSCSVDSYSVAFNAKLPLPRSRCDSGIYSGASSPTGDAVTGVVTDDSTAVLATTGAFSSNGDWRTSSPRRLASSPSVTSSCVERALRQQLTAEELANEQRNRWQPQQQVLNLAVRAAPTDGDLWRPW